MANVNFKRGLQANLPATGNDGTFYLTTDSKRLYACFRDGGAPQLINQTVQIVDNVDALPTLANVNDFYYCSQENVLAVYAGVEIGWTQINPDTNYFINDVEVTSEIDEENDITEYTITLDYNTSTKEPITAKFTINNSSSNDGYSREEVDQKISDELKSLNPLKYKGIITNELPTVEVSCGDIYMASETTSILLDPNDVGSLIYITKGDLFIAQGEENEEGLIEGDINWTYIPAGNESYPTYGLSFWGDGVLALTSTPDSKAYFVSDTLDFIQKEPNVMQVEIKQPISIEWGEF